MSRFNFTASTSSRSTSEDDSGNNTGGGGIPSSLKSYSQWLVTYDTPWNSDRHKAPKYPAEGWNDGNLLTFEEANDYHEQADNTALAFRFTEDDPFVGFDLDDVTRDGEFTDEALGIVRRLDSYTEVSSSGTGLHVIVEGDRSDDHKHREDLSEVGHLEVYDTDRYFVLTANVYDGFASVESRPTSVREVQNDYLPERQKFSFTNQQTSASGQQFEGGETSVDPEQVQRTIEAYVKADKYDVDRAVLHLWEGSDEGRKSPSEADMAFVKQLYYWCKGDKQLMDECFRDSGRMRPKWDELRGDKTYGEMTIQKVCQSNTETFQGQYVQ